MRRRLRKCIIDSWKLVMDVAKFSACFCHESIDHPVCKSLVGTYMYNGRYFSVEKEQSSPTTESRANAVKRQLWCCPSWKWCLPGAVRTKKSKFTALVGFTVVCSYSGEHEGWRFELNWTELKELWRDLSSKKFESVKHKLLYFPYR